MDAATLKAAGFSDQEVKQYTDLSEAGFSDKEISAHLSSDKPPAKDKPKSLTGFVKNVGSDIYETGKGLVDTFANNNPLTVAKGLGGLAVGASEAVQRKLGLLDYPETPEAKAARGIGTRLGEIVSDPLQYGYDKPFSAAMNVSGGLGALGGAAKVGNLTKTGAALGTLSELTNPVALAGKAVSAISNSNIPERLYGSATKMPLSKKWTEVLPGKDMSMRQSGVEAGLTNTVPPSEYGIAKVTKIENQTRQLVDDFIDVGSARGDVVKTQQIIDNGLKKAYERAEKSSDPVGAKAIVDDMAEKFKAHGDEIPTAKLQQIKRQLYDEVKWGGSEQTALVGQLTTMGKKGMAHEAMTSLEAFYPEIKALNKADASYIHLKEALERAVGREANKDIIGLGAKALSVRSIPMAILESTIGHPQVKARLAFALSKIRGAHVDPATISNAVFQGQQINEGTK